MSSEPIDPTSSARAFYAVQLRRIRVAAKMTQADVGAHPAVMVSGKLIEAVENLRRAPTRRLSIGLDTALDLERFFLGLYAAIKRESGIPSEFLEYTEYEETASSIKDYENFLILGLLQTEEYDAPIYPSGAFIFLGFPDEPPVGYAESVNGLGRLVEPGREVTALGVTFDQIGAVALTPADSEKLIQAVLETM
jgi:hypothetical protein